MDIVSKKTRSRMMANIRSSNTRPEILVRKYLHQSGYRFRLKRKVENARPDLVLPKWNVCIFVHGCYWHRHAKCRLASVPKSNVEFWTKKFEQNVTRDRRNLIQLEEAGWSVGIVWECTTRSGEGLKRIPMLIESSRSWEL